MADRYEIARVEEHGLGIIKSRHAHYAMIEFTHDGHSWVVAVAGDDYDVVDTITFGHEEIK